MPTSVLSELLGAEGVARFRESWPNRAMHVHGELTRLPAALRQDSLRSIDAIAEAFRGDLLEVDAQRDYRMVPVTDEGIAGILERGRTAYLGDVSTLVDGMAALLDQLARELGIDPSCARAASFISAAGNGAPCHYDVLDVISVQLVGRKQFHIAPVKEIRFPFGYQYNPELHPFNDLYPQITTGFPDPAEQRFEQVDMRPGSVLCMPRGTWHYTRADEPSMALSIILSPQTEVERLASQLVATLLQSSDWRRPHYGLGHPGDGHYRRLPAVIDALIRREQDAANPSRRFSRASRYLRNPDAQVGIREMRDRYQLTITGHRDNGERVSARSEVPRQTAELFQWFLQQNGPFTVDSALRAFPALTLEFMAQVFPVACESGLLRFLWFEPLR